MEVGVLFDGFPSNITTAVISASVMDAVVHAAAVVAAAASLITRWDQL